MYPNGQFGKKRTDTIYVLPRTALKYFNGFGAFVSLPDTVKSILSGTGYSKWAGSVQSHLTPTQVTADLNLFTSSLQGLTPLSGGGTTNFLRADGTWAAPPGGGGGGGLADSAYFWSRLGNVATFGDFLGTKNNLSFRIHVKDTVRLRIDSLTGVMYPSPRALNSIALITPASATPFTLSNANTYSVFLGAINTVNTTVSGTIAIGAGVSAATVGTGNGNIVIGSGTVSGGGIVISSGNAVSTGGISMGSFSNGAASGIAMGGFASSVGNGVGIGNAATAGGLNSVSLGPTAQSAGTEAIAIGTASRGTHNYSVVIGGRAKSSAANQFVGGGIQTGGSGGISNVYFGTGPSPSAAADTITGIDYTINGSGSSGTNRVGGNITIASGIGTGNAAAKDIIFSTPTAIASGTTLQSLTQRWWIKGGTGQLSTTASPDASLIADIGSTTAFFAPPRMTGAQASAVASPANGSMVYITVTDATFTSIGFWGRENSVWIKL
jgi:hypothetical protein